MDDRIMKIEKMRELKEEQKYSYEKLAELTGLSTETIRKALEGNLAVIDDRVLVALEEVLLSGSVKVLREAQAAYLTKKQQGEFTVEDYDALPDEQRVELIDGVLYDMASPSLLHQMIGGSIYRMFADYIDRNKGKCIPVIAPVDVQLDCDDKTVVQPDIMILCDRSKISEKKKIYGAPDFVLEILSKSTRKIDTIKKLQKYADAGVREYWIVDPEQKRVMVYEFESENERKLSIYGFHDKVPVGIFDGECIVDFAEIFEYVRFLYTIPRTS